MTQSYAGAAFDGASIAASEVAKTTSECSPSVLVRNTMIEIGRLFASGKIQAGEVHVVVQGAASYFRDVASELESNARRCIAAEGKVVIS